MTILLSALLALASPAQSNAAGVNPEIFIGSFTLTESITGMCDESMNTFSSEIQTGQKDYDMGSAFLFSAVNAGPQSSDDELMTIDSNAYTTAGNEMISDRTMVTKASGERSVSHMTAKLSGRTLHLKDHEIQSSPTEPSYSIDTECVYRRAD